jgi:hypothetical protein
VGAVWGNMVFFFAHCSCILMDKVKQWEEEYPDQVDQVPVQAGIFQ